MLHINFMDEQRQAINKIYAQMLMLDRIKSNKIINDLQSYLRNNQFRAYINMTADLMTTTIQGWLWHRYEDSNVRIHKIPNLGATDDFGWQLIGNEEYEKILQDSYYSKGKIITSRDKNIIASPEEEAKGQSLLFRTSHGETVHGDPYINTLTTSFLTVHTPSILRAYQMDITNFSKKMLRNR